MNVFELFAKIGLNTTDYDKGLDSAEKSTESFGTNLKKGLAVAAGVATVAISATATAAVAGTKKFVDAAKATATAGDTIDKQSQKVGFSKKSWQEWDYVLNLAGSSMESATMGIKTLTNKVDAAKKGNKDATAEFKALGISIKSLKNMSREQVFEKVISQLQKMPESSKRAALANKLLGRSGQELSALFNMSNAETKQAIKNANDYGMVLDDKAVKASANFQDSLTTMQNTMTGLKNNMMSQFLPSLTTVMDGLSKVFAGKDTENGMKTIEVGIMSLIDKLKVEMPKFIELGKTIITSVLKGFAPMLPSLVSTIFDIGIQAITTVTSMIPQMMPAIINGIQGVVNALTQTLPIIIDGLTQLIMSLVNWLSEGDNVTKFVNGMVQLVTQIVNSTGLILPVLLPALVKIISELANALTQPDNVQLLLNAVLTVIGAIAVAIVKSVPILANAVKNIIKNLGELLSRFFEFAVPLVADGIENIVNKVKSWGKNLKNLISNFISDTINKIGTFASDILSKLKDLPKNVMSIGSDLVKGLWNGISNMSKWIGEKIKSFGKGVLDGLKSFFKIKSPSRVFRDEIGQFLALGLGEGFEKAMPKTITDMVDIAKDATNEIENAMTIDTMNVALDGATTSVSGGNQAAKTGNSISLGPLTFNLYATEGQDIRELAKAVSREIQNLIDDKEKVYA